MNIFAIKSINTTKIDHFRPKLFKKVCKIVQRLNKIHVSKARGAKIVKTRKIMANFRSNFTKLFVFSLISLNEFRSSSDNFKTFRFRFVSLTTICR